jgi:hypothetical protein
MLADLSPEQALALLRQERLQWIDRRATADDKIRTIDAQIGGAEMVLQMQARAAQATPPAPTPDDIAAEAFAAGQAAAEAAAETET